MTRQLKDPQTFRVFFSSPFKGMEEEREELTRKYFPEIQHKCAEVGLQFVPVDMRWGISKESAQEAQTINICLREIDRSDMMVCFFGQRYGWHGKDDKDLQENFDNAQGKYPWLNDVRDRSVTELELLHGHLNNPGELPSVICFRNKAFDDLMKENRCDAAKFFSSENEVAKMRLLELRKAVQATTDKALAVHMDYQNPFEGAKLMYEAVAKYLEENVLTQLSTKLGQREKEQAPHKAFAVSRTSLYIPCQKNYEFLDRALDQVKSKNDAGKKNKGSDSPQEDAEDSSDNTAAKIKKFEDVSASDTDKTEKGGAQSEEDTDTVSKADAGSCPHMVVVGPAGCGKSALLCNWLNDRVARQEDVIVIPFFVGCAASTRDSAELVDYVYRELESHLDSNQDGKDDENDAQDKDENENKTTASQTPRAQSGDGSEAKEKSSDLKKEKAAARPKGKELQLQLMKKLEDLVRTGRHVVLVFDAINHLVALKISKVLHWLPEKLPQGVMCIISTVDTDRDNLDKLQRQLGYQTLRIGALDHATRRQLCTETLKRSGKELSPEQLDRIVKAEQTGSPLFLKIALAELSIFGKFRELDKKIDSLIEACSTKDLLNKCLRRLEADYNVSEYQGKLVEDILKAIYVSHQGLSESEIINIFQIPSNVWAPFNFAMDFFLMSNLGNLSFAFSEFSEAVKEKYLPCSDAEKKARERLISYFDRMRKQQLYPWMPRKKLEERQFDHGIVELVMLQKEAGDKAGLIVSITDLAVFRLMNMNHDLELLELLQWSGIKGSEFCNLLTKALDLALADCYLAREAGLLGPEESPGVKMRPAVSHMRSFFDLANNAKGQEVCLEREIRILENAKEKMEEKLRLELLRDARYYLACTYATQDRDKQARALHESNMKELERALAEKDDKEIKRQIAYTNNGLGIICMHLGEFDQGIKYILKSAEFHDLENDHKNAAAGYTNLGLMYMYKQEFKMALHYSEKALESYELGSFGQLTMDIGNVYTNIGLIHRRSKRLDKAEEAYLKSLEIKANAVGWHHLVVATAFMNLGTLEMYRSNFAKAEEWTRKAIAVYEANELDKTKKEYRRCRENLFANMLKQEKFEELLPLYIEVFDILNANGWMDECLASMHRRVVRFMLDRKPELIGKAAEVSMALISSSKAHPENYRHLWEADQALPEGKREERPFKYTFDGGLDKFHTTNQYPTMLTLVLEKEVFPTDDRERLKDVIKQVVNNNYMVHNYVKPINTFTEYAQEEKKGELWFDCMKSILKECPSNKVAQSIFLRVCIWMERTSEAVPFLDAIVKSYSSVNGDLKAESVDPIILKMDLAKVLIADKKTAPARQLVLLVAAQSLDKQLKKEAQDLLETLPRDEEDDSKALVSSVA